MLLGMRGWVAIGLLIACSALGQQTPGAGFQGKVRDAKPRSTIQLQGVTAPDLRLETAIGASGDFAFPRVATGRYQVRIGDAVLEQELTLPVNDPAEITYGSPGTLQIRFLRPVVASGGEDLSEKAVSAIPLNKRDFGQLLLLAAGTMTDSNGATNFTAQFAINGQRGVEAVFALDGADTSDPEMGGATFSNFNVDAVAEIQSSSGWMPAEIGRGAAGFTNIVTRSGTNAIHGSAFEFLRNSALDARNFFDKRSLANPGRIPPFRRNEFGVTLGGPLRKDRTFLYAEYQGFRQVLGTTQVLPVPTAAERAGVDTTAIPGDTLLIPVNSSIASVLRRYPLPNEPTGPFGARTYATSSKVQTNADQWSGRLDHQLTLKDKLFARFSANNLKGPTTNPNQTAIDPSFGILYVDHQRSGVVTWTHVNSPRFVSESSISVTRSTPAFPTPNRTDPAITFADSLYEPFNAAGGSVTASFGNLYLGRQNFTWITDRHTVKFGGEFRANRDTTYFGTTPNGAYTFGGGTAYATTNIRSLSGRNDIRVGDPLPDTLSGLLTGSAFAYTVAVAPPSFPQGDQIGVAAASRYGVNLYVQDNWKISDRWLLEYGLRYEVYTPISERAKRTAGVRFRQVNGVETQDYLINPDPVYRTRGNNWGPRVRLNWRGPRDLQVRIGAGLTTIPPNIWQDNLLTGAAPYVDYPRLTAAVRAPLFYGTRITPEQLPPAYTPDGVDILAQAKGDSKKVPANTVWDVSRFARDLAAFNPSRQITPLNVNAISQDFRNAYMGTWSFSMEKQVSSLTTSMAYVGTVGISLPAINFPNAYPGATAQFAQYTSFDSTGQPAGGFGTEMLMTNRSHSSYHALQTSVQGTVPHGGPSLQASYTYGKSIDDASTVIGGYVSGASGAVASAWPQNPFDTRGEKGPSNFDVRHAFTASAIQDLSLNRAPGFHRMPNVLTRGWQLLSVSTLLSGSPFTVYSGVQQTGVGSEGVDRPDQVGLPVLSTARTVREDYFGLGAANASYFALPINLPGGTGPNNGRFGTLGRNTFRGPAFYNFDFALIKDTAIGRRGSAELVNLQTRAEFFNIFNIVNMGLPANTLLGSGFGQINRTAGTSRQIQFSLKLMF